MEVKFRWITCEILITHISDIYSIVTYGKFIICDFKYSSFFGETCCSVIIDSFTSVFVGYINNNIVVWNVSICIINISNNIPYNNNLIKCGIINQDCYISTGFRYCEISQSWIACEVFTTVVCDINSIISGSKWMANNRPDTFFISERNQIRLIVNSNTSIPINYTDRYPTIRNIGISVVNVS